MKFDQVRIFPPEVQNLSRTKKHLYPGLYKGVQFSVLSKGLQKRFLDLIVSFNLEPELFHHIEYLTINREQRLYLELLKEIYDFVKKDVKENDYSE